MEKELDRYSRQILFAGIGEEGQRKLRASKLLLIGCGALGSNIANTMARAGVGKLTIVDRDFVELNNLQRQVMFDEEDVARSLPKAVAAAEKLRKINSQVEIVPLVADVNPGNIEALVRDADLVLDGTDNFETRYLINDTCVSLGKPWVYGGVLASYGVSMTIVPHETPCLRCIFAESPPPGTTPTCDTAGVLASIAAVVANLQCAEAIKLLIGAKDRINRGMVWIDLWENSFERLLAGQVAEGCPCCVQGNYEFLEAREGTRTTSMCGRGAIQVSVRGGASVSFPDLAARLQGAGKVQYNEYMLRFQVDDYELIVFPDARTLVKGVTDEAMARTLYARYVGA
ncbi:MAG: ThiF family adenylyltransferase [Chloroflexota bacterium]